MRNSFEGVHVLVSLPFLHWSFSLSDVQDRINGIYFKPVTAEKVTNSVPCCAYMWGRQRAPSRPVLLLSVSPKWLLLMPFETHTAINLLQNQTLSCHWKSIWKQIALSYRICSSVFRKLGYEGFGFGICFLESELTLSFESISVSAAEDRQGLSLLHVVSVGEPWGWCTAQGSPWDTAFLPTPRPQFLPPHLSVVTMSHSRGADESSFSSLASTVDCILDTWCFSSLHHSRGLRNHNWSPAFVTLPYLSKLISSEEATKITCT